MTVNLFTKADAASVLRAPSAGDDKYSRGVIGFATGSRDYPGAALLGVDGAVSAGIGMVRYHGPAEVREALLIRRPEVVFKDGGVNAWVVGSGMAASDPESMVRVRSALDQGMPAVVDAGAISRLPAHPQIIVTPHAGELAVALGISRAEVEAAPAEHALIGAAKLGATVVLKGNVTHIASQFGDEFTFPPATAWLATAGTGDVLAGIIGALLANRMADETSPSVSLARIASAGVVVHSIAAERASNGGPFMLAGLVEQIPRAVADLLSLNQGYEP